MKTWILLLLLANVGCISASTSETQFKLQVSDCETGLPISNAVAQIQFILKHDPWEGRSKYDHRKTPVGNDGTLEVTGETIRDTGGGATIFADGYYTDGAGFSFTGKNTILNHWEPWNPTLTVKMRPKKNPVPMVHKFIEWKKIPQMNKPVGFDLEKGDWVSPHGTGVSSDLIFTVTGYFQDSQKGSEGRYQLSFSNEHDGIQVFRFPEGVRSSFKWPYEAPEKGYGSSLEKYVYWPPNGGKRKTTYDDEDNYIFRVRSRKMKDGAIVGCYGMIEGDVQVGPRGEIKFKYWFNPVTNEKSLEWNKINLLR